MRSVLIGEVVVLARALRAVPQALRPQLAERILFEARAADRHRRQKGVAHPRFGTGTVATAAGGHALADESFADDPEFCDCLLLALSALRALLHPRAQEIQRCAVGSSSSRLTAISSPQSSQ